jgi:hypothetical protein
MERDHPRQAPETLDGLVRAGAHPFQARTIHAGWDARVYKLVDGHIDDAVCPVTTLLE